MQGFYEKYRDESDIYVNMNSSLLFPTHFHRNIEVVVILRGKYEITVSGKKYIVDEGSIVVVDGYEIHSYDRCLTEGESEAAVAIFPSAYIESFNFSRKNKSLASPIIKDKRLCLELCEIMDKYLSREGRAVRQASELFFALLSEGLTLCDKKRSDDGALVRRILVYIEEGFKGDITRERIARELGYTEAHISRVFHSFIGKGIREYINEVRLSYIDSKISLGDSRGILALIEEAGFGSQQTYYRARNRKNTKRRDSYIEA